MTHGERPARVLLADDNLRVREGLKRLVNDEADMRVIAMRVEKSGMGDSEGPPCESPQADFNAEVRAYVAG